MRCNKDGCIPGGISRVVPRNEDFQLVKLEAEC